MLVLQRKQGEEIVIGGSVHVRVLAIHGNHVRLGLTAPGEVVILRQECLTAGRLEEADPPRRRRRRRRPDPLVEAAPGNEPPAAPR